MNIKNENEQSRTKIYHEPTAEPYYLPYTSDNLHRYHGGVSHSSLLRTARFCSDLDDFNRDRLRIDVPLLLNDYPPKLIINQFLRF